MKKLYYGAKACLKARKWVCEVFYFTHRSGFSWEKQTFCDLLID